MAQLLRKPLQILRFGDARSGTIAHKNKNKKYGKQPLLRYSYFSLEESPLQNYGNT